METFVAGRGSESSCRLRVFYKSRTDNRNIKQTMSITSKIRAWKEKRLRKKIILRLLSSRNYNPNGGQIIFVAEDILNYINTGLTYRME